MSEDSKKEKLYNTAVNEAGDFLVENNYTSYSTPDLLNSTFIKSLENYLNTNLWTLGAIAEEFEANPAIHLSKFKTEIYLAIDLISYLFDDKTEDVEANVNKLKTFLNENNS